eukprot:NODE_3940_length_890_cov_161.464923_g3628_i0.p1 GENE.NODE_3940_length_890_cov_161.464923_g3628_i0~~NODE_3940_length_890_cov_161.464923_g3628_i0.p1  ORF type:complete len:245 (-),score=60.77 NODE_3940_length_890_cov_161.464923_g3628_i0:154-825(-)
MMLLITLAVVLVAGGAQADRVCLPPQHTFFLHHTDTQAEESDIRQEFNDFTNDMYAWKQIVWRDHAPRGEELYHHTWLFPKMQTAYRYTFRREFHRNVSECFAYKIPPIAPRTPCFTSNATQQRQYTVGGTLLVDEFYAEDHSPEESKFQIIGVSPVGIPVEVIYWINRRGGRPNDHGLETYHDVSTELPSDAFTVDAACTNAVVQHTTPEDVLAYIHRRIEG